MESPLSINTLQSLKSSYANVVAFFRLEENSCNFKLDCLSKWGAQLGINPIEVHRMLEGPSLQMFEKPTTSIDALSQVYDLVYMVFMDEMVEDIELELVSTYARSIGLESYVVNNILKAIVAAQLDGVSNELLRSDLLVHPEVYV